MKGKQAILKNNISAAIAAKLTESGTTSSKKVNKAVEKSAKKLVKKLVKISMKEIRNETRRDGVEKKDKKAGKGNSKSAEQTQKPAPVTAKEPTGGIQSSAKSAGSELITE